MARGRLYSPRAAKHQPKAAERRRGREQERTATCLRGEKGVQREGGRERAMQPNRIVTLFSRRSASFSPYSWHPPYFPSSSLLVSLFTFSSNVIFSHSAAMLGTKRKRVRASLQLGRYESQLTFHLGVSSYFMIRRFVRNQIVKIQLRWRGTRLRRDFTVVGILMFHESSFSLKIWFYAFLICCLKNA